MTNNRKIEVSDLDFFGIKDNLKSYLSGLDQFNDFNFEGSGASILLDLLAYVTHYQGFYNNMVANELFLDSAVKRTSVISHAKALGYTPSSSSASTAVVDVTINSTDTSTTYLTKRTNFTAVKDGVSYTFSNPDVETFEVLNSTQKIARNVTLVEGTWRNFSFIVDSNISNQRFIIPDKNIDMDKLNIFVQTSTTDTTGYADTWTKSSDVIELTSTSKVYFTQETEDGFYEIYFGDGILGASLSDNNLIVVDYLITNGSPANNIGPLDKINSRSFSSSFSNISDIEVITTSNGGGGKETLNSIKYNAPKSYQSQNRSVTANDYRSYIKTNYTNASDVFVWGGEDNNPPEYGKVFVCVKPTNSSVLNNEEKISLQNSIKEKNIVSVIPEVVDPNYIYLNITSKIFYDADATTKTTKDIKTLVEEKILVYKVTSLEKFGRNLRYSKFVKELDESDSSILSNQTSIVLQKRITPTRGEEKSYTIKFENPIYHPHSGHIPVVSSSQFTYTKTNGETVNAYIDDNDGVLKIYELSNNEKTYIVDNVGSVDYEQGIVTLEKFNPTLVTDTILKINCVPADKDIISERSSIIVIDSADPDSVNISAESYLPFSTISSNE
tara:strand:+ start:15511 stop:17346 length:1836 start_codon:yes stop_codon:yes gene_type:complete